MQKKKFPNDPNQWAHKIVELTTKEKSKPVKKKKNKILNLPLTPIRRPVFFDSHKLLKVVDMPLYNFAKFDSKPANLKLTRDIKNEKNLCLLEAQVFELIEGKIGAGTFVPAMIDTGAERSVISEEIFMGMNLQRNESAALLKGFTGTRKSFYTPVAIAIPELGQGILAFNVLVNPHLKESPFDLILGNDFLAHFRFERDGKNKTFNLSFIEG